MVLRVSVCIVNGMTSTTICYVQLYHVYQFSNVQNIVENPSQYVTMGGNQVMDFLQILNCSTYFQNNLNGFIFS